MKYNIFGLMLVSAVVLSACGNSSGNGGDSSPSSPISINMKTESLSYQFEFNGCKTGQHQFNSRDELCKGLQNETINNGCAVQLREEHFKTQCSGQTFQAFDEHQSQSVMPKAAEAQAGDVLSGDTLVRTILVGQGSLVLFKNPTGESAKTMVYCLPDSEAVKSVLSDSKMGGIMLIKGTKIILKNDNSRSFTDGTNLRGEYIQIQCL